MTDAPAADDLEVLRSNLETFNDRDAGAMDRRPLAIFLRGVDGTMQAGLSGYTAWSWLFTQWLWVAADVRGQGVAGRMLAMAETEALARGCHGAWIDTFNPVALAVYRRSGYEVFGELAEFLPGRARFFLRKPLVRE